MQCRYYKKAAVSLQLSLPLIHEGAYQLLLYDVVMNILQQIFSDHYSLVFTQSPQYFSYINF